MKIIKFLSRLFLSMSLLTPLIGHAGVKPIKIEKISDAINYLGYNDKIAITVPDIKENYTPYILPVQTENGYSKNLISFFGDVPIKNIRKEDNAFILEFDNKDRCLDYYYNRIGDFKQISIKACDNYVSKIMFIYSSKSNYRFSSEELEQRFNKIVDNIKSLGFAEISKKHGILDSIGKYFSTPSLIIKLEKEDTDIIVQMNSKSNNIFISVAQKDSHKKYLEIKDKISHNKAVDANKKIDDFIK